MTFKLIAANVIYGLPNIGLCLLLLLLCGSSLIATVECMGLKGAFIFWGVVTAIPFIIWGWNAAYGWAKRTLGDAGKL